MDGVFNIGVVAAGTTSSADVHNYFDNSAVTALNNESQAAIELFGTWSASNAANTTTLKQLWVYGVN